MAHVPLFQCYCQISEITSLIFNNSYVLLPMLRKQMTGLDVSVHELSTARMREWGVG